ncbi:hypothetical protein [Streptomyces sp. NPDC007083]|uniref:hypothetical protein n=1 Tax=Streptomyces sp. NPDC007083 TaxID=3156913 RepID=UPI00340D2848
MLRLGLIGALLVPVLMVGFASSAFAADCGGSDEDEECKNYSLYQLASNASTYFGEKNSPDKDDGLDDRWEDITKSPATGGSLLGYADPEFSVSNIIGWFFAEVSGSSQTVTYDTLKAAEGGDEDDFGGMLDYAHFGAANKDLGLDTMSSGIGGEIIGMIGGSAVWAFYALALSVSLLFGLIIILLKMLNPFMWFSEGVKAVNTTFGEGMSAHGDATVADGPLKGLASWISDWYQLLNSIAWEALVPLFIAFLLLGLVLFKKMDRGSAIKKLIVRIVYMGVGLPLIGSMYTNVLDKFDDLGVASAGPTRVVLSTYVDFEGWIMRDRLAVPEDAVIGWDKDQASSDAMMNVRTSALAINKQAHPKAYADINMGTHRKDAGTAWKDGSTNLGKENENDTRAVFTTFGLLIKYITSQAVAASDFESGTKSSITKLDVDSEDKSDWFVNKDTYGDAKDFGHDGDPSPKSHPVISTFDQEGLTSSSPGGNKTTFTTENSGAGCGFKVMEDDDPAPCNLAPLAAYNYLNTGFDASSLTMYSSNNATSGFTRENHMSVSQVGTGPAKFMYWSNTVTILVCLVLLGFWYAIGMLVGSVKRTFSLVAAIPFATLGAIAAISKVIVYSVALILEVIITLFLYSFVSEFLVGIPGIIAGPISNLVTQDGIFGSTTLGGIVVAVLTLISSLLVVGVTFALLRVRKVVLQAMDEVVTKLVNKFLETNTAPKPDKSGMLPALASGAGAGAGMAMGNKIASGLGSKLGGGPKTPSSGKPGGKTKSTNAGGTNGDPKALASNASGLALKSGDGPEVDGPDGSAPDSGGHGPGGGSDGSPGSRDEGEGDGDKGGPLQLASSTPGSSRSDKETAQNLSSRGGLSSLGYDSGQGSGEGGQTHFGMGALPGSKSSGDAQGSGGGKDEPGAGRSHGHTTMDGSSNATSSGMGQQGASGSRGPGPQGQIQGQGARFTAGTTGPVAFNQSDSPVPGTRATRSSQDQRPQGQAGGSSRPHNQGTRSLPQADNQQQRTQPVPGPTRAPNGRSMAPRPTRPTGERQGTPQASPSPPPTRSRGQQGSHQEARKGDEKPTPPKPKRSSAPGSRATVTRRPNSAVPPKPKRVPDPPPPREPHEPKQ